MADKVVKAKADVKVGKGKKMYVTVDNSVNEVLSWVNDGYSLIFEGEPDKFLKLPTEVYKALSLPDKENYMMAREESVGRNPISTVQEGLQGWKRDFNITPGDPSSKLQVHGKKDAYNYRWSIPERLGKRGAQGWEVDLDPDIRTYDQHESEVGNPVAKTVGGHNAPEYVLVRRRKDVAAKFKADRQAIYDGRTTKAKDGFREGVERLGAEAALEPFMKFEIEEILVCLVFLN